MEVTIEKVGSNQGDLAPAVKEDFGGIKFVLERIGNAVRARIFAGIHEHVDMVECTGEDVLGGGIVRYLHRPNCEVKFSAYSLTQKFGRDEPSVQARRANPNIKRELLAALKAALENEFPA